MQDTSLQNQSLNQVGSLPPLPQSGPTAVASTPTSPSQDANLPTKKKSNKFKYLIGGFLALLIVGGVGFGAFYFTQNLNQASVPTTPSSEPQASGKKWQINPVTGKLYNTELIKQNSDGSFSLTPSGAAQGIKINHQGTIINQEDNGGGTATTNTTTCTATAPTNLKVENISTNSAKLSWTPGTGEYVKLWVSSAAGSPTLDCSRLPNKQTDAVCVVNENGKLTNGVANHADIPRATTTWNVTGLKPATTYRWRLMMWSASSCDSSAEIVSFTTTALPACVSGVNTTTKQDSCTATGITEGTKSLGYTCKNQTGTDLKVITRTDCTELSALKAQAELLCKQQYPCSGETACVDSTWTPATTTVCKDTKFLQKSNCNIEREVVGTKTDGTCSATSGAEPELTIEKKAYEDESTNKAGDYDLNYEADMVSKNQVIVYAFEVTNDGDGDATDIKVVDILKGDNRELLTYMDGESECSYASSSRTVTCDGMDLKAGESGVYAFRVRVSDSAINGDTIKNVGEISYKNMPSGGEVDSSNELTISTVVGCNHVCTSDDECSGGLTCDPDSNKCRRPACSDATSCNCPVERDDTDNDPTPTRRAATSRPEPTELVEAGILDFPGVAAFGGGLLLAVIGILLAL